jgi:hypothetical protein
LRSDFALQVCYIYTWKTSIRFGLCTLTQDHRQKG